MIATGVNESVAKSLTIDPFETASSLLKNKAYFKSKQFPVHEQTIEIREVENQIAKCAKFSTLIVSPTKGLIMTPGDSNDPAIEDFKVVVYGGSWSVSDGAVISYNYVCTLK